MNYFEYFDKRMAELKPLRDQLQALDKEYQEINALLENGKAAYKNAYAAEDKDQIKKVLAPLQVERKAKYEQMKNLLTTITTQEDELLQQLRQLETEVAKVRAVPF